MSNISDDLFLAILSMDAYNRGYGAGIIGLSDGLGTAIGNATVLRASSSQQNSPEVAAGFYAIAYNWNGRTVISYRGTNDLVPTAVAGSDVINGWITGTGKLINGTQAAQAIEFYNTVTGGNVLAGQNGNAILTGHSLGGGFV